MAEAVYDIPLDQSTFDLNAPFAVKTLVFVNGSNANLNVQDDTGRTFTIGAGDGGPVPVLGGRHFRLTSATSATSGSCYVIATDRRLPGAVGALTAGGTGANVNVTNFPATTAITSADGAQVALGALADAAWVSGNGNIISVLKGVFGRLANLVSLAFNAAGALIVDSRAAANMASGQVASSTTAATLVAARATRQSVVIRNLDAAITVYVGPATVTAANGMQIKAGESLVLNNTALIQVIAASGTPTVAYLEEYS